MKRIYHNYKKWEDYQNGMFNTDKVENEVKLTQLARSLLCNEIDFFRTGVEMVKSWEYAASENITNKSSNRLSWIGQATCSFKHKIPEWITRKAWNTMSDKQQRKANSVARSIIKEYERTNTKLHKGMGEQMLLQWDT